MSVNWIVYEISRRDLHATMKNIYFTVISIAFILINLTSAEVFTSTAALKSLAKNEIHLKKSLEQYIEAEEEMHESNRL